MYSKLYYEERIKPAVLEELENSRPEGVETPGEIDGRRLRAMHMVRQCLWLTETPEVRETVRATLERDYPKVKERGNEDGQDFGASGDNGDGDDNGLTPAEAQRYVRFQYYLVCKLVLTSDF